MCRAFKKKEEHFKTETLNINTVYLFLWRKVLGRGFLPNFCLLFQSFHRVLVKLGEPAIDCIPISSGLNHCMETQIVQRSVERKVRVFQAKVLRVCTLSCFPDWPQDDDWVMAKVSRKLYYYFKPVTHPVSQDFRNMSFFFVFFVLNSGSKCCLRLPICTKVKVSDNISKR